MFYCAVRKCQAYRHGLSKMVYMSSYVIQSHHKHKHSATTKKHHASYTAKYFSEKNVSDK